MEQQPMNYASFTKRMNAYGWDALVILGLSLLVYVTPSLAADPAAEQIRTLIDAGLLPPGTTAQSLAQTLAGGDVAPDGTTSGGLFSMRDLIMPIVLSAVYNIAFVAGEWQATPGKRFSGIKVVMADGSKPTLLQSAMRHVASGLSVAIFWLGFLPVLWTKERTALHDTICNTRVIMGRN